VRLPNAYTARVEEMLDHYGCTKSTLFRMGLDALWYKYNSPPDEIAFEGDADTQEMKWTVVRCFAEQKGPAMAAREAKTTRATITHWMKTDKLFAEVAHDARAEAIEIIEHLMWRKGAKEENLTAAFGLLNAKHEHWGLMKQGFVDKQVRRVVESQVIPLVQRYLSGRDMESLGRELRAIFGEPDGRALPGAGPT
jgi:hypothetical protein